MDWKEAEIAKMLASCLRCEQCDGSFAAEDIGLAGQRDGWWFFMVRCTSCGESRVAVVLVRDEVDLREEQCTEKKVNAGADVTWDDVLDIHLFLKKFKGDFKSLLTKPI